MLSWGPQLTINTVISTSPWKTTPTKPSCFRTYHSARAQGTLPCMTREGKIILETASRVAMAPDGNGGIYPALQRKGALADMRKRGVEHVHVFSIDNALVRVADPHFLGYCIEKKADCGNKSVWKAEPGEKVRVRSRRLVSSHAIQCEVVLMQRSSCAGKRAQY